MWRRASVIQLLGAYSSEGRESEPNCGLLTDGELPWSCLVEQCAVAQMGALNTIRTSLAGPSLIPEPLSTEEVILGKYKS